jgi:hypothetical protein
MAFKFEWPRFDKEFEQMAAQQLQIALNKGSKRPDHICDDILVKELSMGSVVRHRCASLISSLSSLSLCRRRILKSWKSVNCLWTGFVVSFE